MMINRIKANPITEKKRENRRSDKKVYIHVKSRSIISPPLLSVVGNLRNLMMNIDPHSELPNVSFSSRDGAGNDSPLPEVRTTMGIAQFW